jgi:predicted transcriptional regulator
MMKKPMQASEIAYELFVRGDKHAEAELNEERQKLKLVDALRNLRTELARRVGTTPSVISRLEDPDYDGHSLKTLRRIVDALGLSLELNIVKRTGRKGASKVIVHA